MLHQSRGRTSIKPCFIVTVILLALLACSGIGMAEFVPAYVQRVIDGDTFVVQINQQQETVRLIGIDTPETVHPTLPPQAWGKEASDYTKSILPRGTRVHLEFDVQIRDRYGRLLAYAYLENGKMLNAELLKEGLAQVATFPPNVAYLDLFLLEQSRAQTSCKGLWEEGCRFTSSSASLNMQVDLYQEFVLLDNQTDHVIDLSGWLLLSVRGCQRFVFPKGTVLPAQGSLKVVSGPHHSQQQGVLFWSSSPMWNNSGDPAILYDAQGNRVTSVPQHAVNHC